jgi:hypothetical protein
VIGVDPLPSIPLVVAATPAHNPHSACLSVQDVCAAAAGEPGAPATTRRAASFSSETAEADDRRPNLLGLAEARVGRPEFLLIIVKPETVVAWHRKGFRLFWAWKIYRGKPGRPSLPQEIRELIRMMSRNNPRWGAPRIHGELLKLGIEITEPTVAKYVVRSRKPPSQSWRTFLNNHVKSMVSVDFFVVPTVRFQILYVFRVLSHDRRRIVHFGVTAHPTGVDSPATS